MDSMGAMHGAMEGMDDPVMAPGPWQGGAFAPTFLMWSVMMVAMMLPSAMPAMVLYGSIVRKNRAAGSVLPSTWIFAAGYLSVWTGFALAAAILQAALDKQRSPDAGDGLGEPVADRWAAGAGRGSINGSRSRMPACRNAASR